MATVKGKDGLPMPVYRNSDEAAKKGNNKDYDSGEVTHN
jgi:hypothetical protein